MHIMFDHCKGHLFQLWMLLCNAKEVGQTTTNQLEISLTHEVHLNVTKRYTFLRKF